MHVLGGVHVLLFDILSVIEAMPSEVALLVFIFKGLFVLAKVM